MGRLWVRAGEALNLPDGRKETRGNLPDSTVHDTAPKFPRIRPDLGIHAEESIEASSDARAMKAELMGWTRGEAVFVARKIGCHSAHPLNGRLRAMLVLEC